MIVSLVRDSGISVAAHDDRGSFAGRLTWYHEGIMGICGDRSFQVASLFVREDARRQGIATALYRYALEENPRLLHSCVRSVAGEAFRLSVGGPTARCGIH